MPRTVMVIDDDSEIVDMTRLILEGGGYEVISAASGQEALRTLERTRPELILLDINMPGMDGFQVLRLLKVDERTNHIPVALFSIKTAVRDHLHGLQEGAFDYITKPFSCDELLGRVERIFQSLGQRQASG